MAAAVLVRQLSSIHLRKEGQVGAGVGVMTSVYLSPFPAPPPVGEGLVITASEGVTLGVSVNVALKNVTVMSGGSNSTTGKSSKDL